MLLLLTSIYFWGARYWIDPFEEGYFAYLASRVAAGELPYRDFSMPYTPGYVYLHGWLFQWFGFSLVPQRVGVIAARIVATGLLYVIARRVAPPRYAILPPLLMLLTDPAPVPWHPHPSWHAFTPVLGVCWAVLRYSETARPGWLLLAGALAGASFLFKQNIGLLALIAAGSYVVSAPTRPREGGTGVVKDHAPAALGLVLAGAAALATPLAFTWTLRNSLSLEYLAEYVLPLLALNAWLVTRFVRAPGSSTALQQLAGPLLLGLGFAAVSLLWIAGLGWALGLEHLPIRQFFGDVSPEGYEMEQWWPRPEALLTVLLVPVACWAWLLWHRGPTGRLQAVGLLALWAGFSAFAAYLLLGSTLTIGRAAVAAAVQGTENLNLLLPAVASWLLVLALLRGWARPDEEGVVTWLGVFGMTMFFHQYPRMDEPHLIFSAPPVALSAAWLLSRSETRLTQQVSHVSATARAMLALILLALPLAASWPIVHWRGSMLLARDPGELLPGPITYATVQAERAGVLAPPYVAEPLGQVVEEIRARTAPGEPIFVFPASPMVYYLADRPNATRFNHLLAGLLTADDEAEVRRRLAQPDVRLVVIEPEFEVYWLRSDHYMELRRLLRRDFSPVSRVGSYELRLRQG